MNKDLITDRELGVWVYNIGADKIWAPPKMGILKVSNDQERQILNRLAEMMLFLTRKTDILYLVAEPDTEFLKDMEIFGIEKPEIRLLPQELPYHFSEYIAGSESCRSELKNYLSNMNNDNALYIPYIVTQQDEDICKDLRIGLWGAKASIARNVNSKVFARQVALELGFNTTDGFVCSCQEELEAGYHQLREQGYRYCVIKEPYGTSGKGVHFIKDEKTFNNLKRLIKFSDSREEFQVVLEGWIEDKTDINYQVVITPSGEVRLLMVNEQLIKQTSYKGTRFPPGISAGQMDTFSETAEAIGKHLYQKGYIGILGIDAIVRGNGEIIPVLEFNGRFNQSTFYLPIFSQLQAWKRQAIIKYYDIRTSEYLDYRRLREYFNLNGKAFSVEEKKGIMIINSSCLSYSFDESEKSYLSRAFIAIISEEGKNPEDIIAEADSLIKLI
ncbi:MAG TPA: ATP-grasp domain-containing protein [Ruminiclostridium sp.]|nr:ATP-grasp domain-containing protein [Ruminiclostridium sp.]